MPVLFDSSVYVAALRLGSASVLPLMRWAGESPLWLSSVVLEELYAGATPGDMRTIAKLERDFAGAGRLLVPNLSDWTTTGRILAKLGGKYGYERIGRGRLTNDALIAMSAARTGTTIVTANPRDFARLGQFRAFSWRVQPI